MLGSSRVLSVLSEEDLAAIFLAAEPIFPDIDRSSGWVSPADNAREFVQGIPRMLAARGTSEAVAALEQIADARPDLDWIKRSVLVDARKKLMEVSWEPPTIEQVRGVIASRGEKELVRSEAELLRACQRSLLFIEDNLQGRLGGTPQAFLLWNEDRPKEENRLSDYLAAELKRSLAQRAIIANREVQVRPSRLVSENAPKGQQTDVLVQAMSASAGEPLTVVVEVKGCWHSELKEAMKAQLVDRYLTPNGFRYGLYVVVWCQCDSWAPKDYRKSNGNFRTIEEAREYFELQATALSSDEILLKSIVLDASLV